ALGGMIRQAFSRRGVSFTQDGSPEARPASRHSHLSVEVAGPAGPKTEWTRRAIRRAGFAEEGPGTEPRLTVSVSEAGWVIKSENEEPEHADSILELVGCLRRRARLTREHSQ
ncbi:MAG: hypothetical protein GVY23_07465, partial [Spirochaetes bacterium]|nr:hypothetical protein [Spirochaetota bacterium]